MSIPIDQVKALAEADTLHMLPPEALVASIKDLAGDILEREARDQFFEHGRTELMPKMKESSSFVSLCPPDNSAPDPKFCMELGAAVYMDKPILAVAIKGRDVPPGIRRVAHAVVEGVDIESDAGRDDLAEKVKEFVMGYVDGR